MAHDDLAATHDVDPIDFGAVGDGVADDTAAWQRAIAAASGRRIHLRGRTYRVGEIVLVPHLRGIVGPGVLRAAATIDTGLIHCARTTGHSAPVIRDLRLADFTIDVGLARCGIEFVGVDDSVIENCRIITSRDLQKGIWLRDSCRRNALRGNTVTAPVSATLASLVCVTIESELTASPYFHDQPGEVAYIETTTDNVIDGNWIEGGTHGVALSGSMRTRVVNNRISGNAHRNINICPASRYNIVSHNLLLEAGSSAVAMAYGASDNIVTDNQIASWSTMPDYDRDAIHAYVASGGNRIAGNVIVGDFRYGVYLAIGARGNLVQDNRIRLDENPRSAEHWSAGIVLESDWVPRPLPPEAVYSRQNFGAAPDGYRWAYEDSRDNVIQGNQIEKSSCGIYLAQIGDRGLTTNRIADNRCLETVPLELCVCSASPELFRHNRITLDPFGIGSSRIAGPDWLEIPQVDRAKPAQSKL